VDDGQKRPVPSPLHTVVQSTAPGALGLTSPGIAGVLVGFEAALVASTTGGFDDFASADVVFIPGPPPQPLFSNAPPTTKIL